MFKGLSALHVKAMSFLSQLFLLTITIAFVASQSPPSPSSPSSSPPPSSSISFLQTRTSHRVWSCCRVCPQEQLREIDQLFGSTPPPVRKFDEDRDNIRLQEYEKTKESLMMMEEGEEVEDEMEEGQDMESTSTTPAPPPTISNFLEAFESLQHQARAGEGDCCTICAIGVEAIPPPPRASQTPQPDPSGGKKWKVPLANLHFSSDKTSLMPPCCPHCNEQAGDEAYYKAVTPGKMKLPPEMPMLIGQGGGVMGGGGNGGGNNNAPPMNNDASLPPPQQQQSPLPPPPQGSFLSHKIDVYNPSAFLELATSSNTQRDYTYTRATSSSCCNRCFKPPTYTEIQTEKGANLWPQPPLPPQEALADDGTPDIINLRIEARQKGLPIPQTAEQAMRQKGKEEKKKMKEVGGGGGVEGGPNSNSKSSPKKPRLQRSQSLGSQGMTPRRRQRRGTKG